LRFRVFLVNFVAQPSKCGSLLSVELSDFGVELSSLESLNHSGVLQAELASCFFCKLFVWMFLWG